MTDQSVEEIARQREIIESCIKRWTGVVPLMVPPVVRESLAKDFSAAIQAERDRATKAERLCGQAFLEREEHAAELARPREDSGNKA